MNSEGGVAGMCVDSDLLGDPLPSRLRKLESGEPGWYTHDGDDME